MAVQKSYKEDSFLINSITAYRPSALLVKVPLRWTKLIAKAPTCNEKEVADEWLGMDRSIAEYHAKTKEGKQMGSRVTMSFKLRQIVKSLNWVK